MNPIIAVVSILGGVISGVVASGKGRSGIGWGLLGMCFPLIGVIVACTLQPAPHLIAAMRGEDAG